MKVLVTSEGDAAENAVDRRFGRASTFLLFDTETGDCTAHANTQNLNAVQGAGIQAAQHAVNLDADVVITGHCGPKAFKVLQAAGISIVLDAQGSASGMIEQFLAGALTFAESPDVEGHWV